MIAALISAAGPYLVTGAAALFALFVAYIKGRGDGKAKAQTDNLKRDVAARDEQLEMHREATQAEIDAAALSDEEARKRALEWAKR